MIPYLGYTEHRIRSWKNHELSGFCQGVNANCGWEKMEKKERGERLILWSFDDVILKPGTAFGKQPIGQHFSVPLDG
jgi:hypothetical protein